MYKFAVEMDLVFSKSKKGLQVAEYLFWIPGQTTILKDGRYHYKASWVGLPPFGLAAPEGPRF